MHLIVLEENLMAMEIWLTGGLMIPQLNLKKKLNALSTNTINLMLVFLTTKLLMLTER